jgi:hypothetical protein
MTSDTPPTSSFFQPPEPPKPLTRQTPPVSRPPRHLSTAQFWALIGGVILVTISAGVFWNQVWNRPSTGDARVSTAKAKLRVGRSERQAAQEAARALKAVQSVTQLGVTYREYQPRIGDAKIKVDQYVARSGHDVRLGALLNRVMGYYTLANQAWAVSIRGDGAPDWHERKEAVWKVMQATDCGPLRAFTEAHTKSLWLWGRRPEYVGDDLEQKIFGPVVPTIWQCASQALIELDEALGGGG